MSIDKSPLRVELFQSLKFVPRFEYGEMAEVAEICGSKDGTELGTGFVRLTNAKIPWSIDYDEVLTVIEGVLHLHANGETHELNRLDSIWLPAGTKLIYESESVLISYAVHPMEW